VWTFCEWSILGLNILNGLLGYLSKIDAKALKSSRGVGVTKSLYIAIRKLKGMDGRIAERFESMVDKAVD